MSFGGVWESERAGKGVSSRLNSPRNCNLKSRRHFQVCRVFRFWPAMPRQLGSSKVRRCFGVSELSFSWACPPRSQYQRVTRVFNCRAVSEDVQSSDEFWRNLLEIPLGRKDPFLKTYKTLITIPSRAGSVPNLAAAASSAISSILLSL